MAMRINSGRTRFADSETSVRQMVL